MKKLAFLLLIAFSSCDSSPKWDGDKLLGKWWNEYSCIEIQKAGDYYYISFGGWNNQGKYYMNDANLFSYDKGCYFYNGKSGNGICENDGHLIVEGKHYYRQE